jgi:3'-phosphoadenosine 5'-phosphosulfate sulfotransferase
LSNHLKYLSVRYSIESELSEFTNRYEGYFTETEIKKRVIERDNNYKNVKWISLEEVKSIVNEMQTRYSHGIHNIDFIYFEKPGNDFVLVRVDADNNFSVGNGVIGVTFIVFTSRSIKVYFELFKKMFNKAEQTFAGLTKTSL